MRKRRTRGIGTKENVERDAANGIFRVCGQGQSGAGRARPKIENYVLEIGKGEGESLMLDARMQFCHHLPPACCWS